MKFASVGIKPRIVAAYTLVFGVLLIGFATSTYFSIHGSRLKELDSQLAIFASRTAEDIAQDTEDNEATDPHDLEEFVPDGLLDPRVQVWERMGSRTLSDSLLSRLQILPPLEVDEEDNLAQSVSTGIGQYRIYWQPVEIDGEYPFIVQSAASMDGIKREMSQLLWLFLGLVPLSLLVAGGAAYALMKAAFRPIDQMTDTVRKITIDELDSRLAVPQTDDEVKRLAETLNGMLMRIEAAFLSQQRFIADASHELRTPLTVMRTELEFAAKNSDSAQTTDSIRKAIAETTRIERLTNQLLLLVRLDAGSQKIEFVPTRLDDLLVDCARHLAPLALAKNIEILLHIAEALEIRGDAALLSSAICNIVENAIKYSMPGSHVLLGLAPNPENSNSILISVTDSGSGVAQAEQEQIFRRFYRAKEHRGESNGSGLGLSIANDIVGLHHGKIRVKSELGKGSEFFVELPLA